MFLIVGLGNPGREYENTRHNVGFFIADEIRREHKFSVPKIKFHSELSEGHIDGQKILLQKPLTYMNLSGNSVIQAAKFLKIDLDKIIVIHDDLDLAVGKVKVKTGGGNGGHNGLRDIDAHIGREYQRVRVGIGHPGNKDMVADYVLHKFGKDDREIIDIINTNIARNIALLIAGKNDLFIASLGRVL
jgi:PTH1 family peptidyl-tRNA hydrolase